MLSRAPLMAYYRRTDSLSLLAARIESLLVTMVTPHSATIIIRWCVLIGWRHAYRRVFIFIFPVGKSACNYRQDFLTVSRASLLHDHQTLLVS
jgi:hypothetical protein